MENLIKTLKTFYGFEAKKKVWFAIFLFVVVVAATADSITPYFYKLFVDSISSSQHDKLLTLLIIFVVVKIVALLLMSLSFLLGDFISFQAGIDARIKIFKHIQDLDFAFHSSKSTGSLISAFKRGDNAFFSLHHSIHHRILEILIAFLVMFYFFIEIDAFIALLVFVSFLINLAITKFVVNYNVATRARFNDEEDKISGIIVDNIINYETVKLFSKESWEEDRLRVAFVDWKKRLWGYANSFRFLDQSVGGLINISIFIILYVALRRVSAAELGLGDFVLVLGFISAFFPRFFDLVYGFRDIAKNYADIQKYFEILDYEIQIKDPDKPVEPDSITGEIRFENVVFSYKEGKKNAVKNISLRVRQGQSIALVGRSGSGKTTLIKLLMRFYDVASGHITLDGVDIKDFRKSHLRSFIGVVPQEPILFNNTIAYNIAYGKDKATQKEIEAAAKIANLHDFIVSLPKKYKTDVGERGIKLSGGQKQRLAIARMILSDPQIIIFDEATSQLDSENEKLIQEALWKAVKDKTTIIIAHRLSTAMRADKIIVMENGRILESGSHSELIVKDKSLYRYLWSLQTSDGKAT